MDVLSKIILLKPNDREDHVCFPVTHEEAPTSTSGRPSLSIVQKAMEGRLQRLEIESGSFEDDDSFFVVDIGYIHRQHTSWTERIPRALPCYAVKCNPDLSIINFLASLGAGFDCASSNEMQLVLSQGISPERIIFSNPCKMRQDLRFARAHNVAKTTFDNADELHKIKNIFPEAQLFIRIFASDRKAKYDLSEKFGASEESATSLLQLAKKLMLNVVGVSFHVGSGAVDPQAFEDAIRLSRKLFDHGQMLGLAIKSLDIGGGFSEAAFPVVSAHVTRSLNHHFPEDVEIFAEPGRFFAEGAMTLACCVIARRGAGDPGTEGARDMLYLNDGIYGNFLSCAFEPPPIPRILYGGGCFFPDEADWGADKELSSYFIWGPTCDPCDVINKGVRLQKGLRIGDWLYYNNMGAYSSALATTFNGFVNKRKAIYVGTTSAAKSFLRDQNFLEENGLASLCSPAGEAR